MDIVIRRLGLRVLEITGYNDLGNRLIVYYYVCRTFVYENGGYSDCYDLEYLISYAVMLNILIN